MSKGNDNFTRADTYIMIFESCKNKVKALKERAATHENDMNHYYSIGLKDKAKEHRKSLIKCRAQLIKWNKAVSLMEEEFDFHKNMLGSW